MKIKNALETTKTLVNHIGRHLAQKSKDEKNEKEISLKKMDEFQTIAYDFAWIYSEVYASEQILAYAEKNSQDSNTIEALLAEIFTAETISHVSEKIGYRAAEWGATPDILMQTIWNPEVTAAVGSVLTTENYNKAAKLIADKNHGGTYGLGEQHEMFRQTFKKFAEDNVMPLAEKVHRHDLLIPQEILNGLKELGCFGLSIPQQFGGFQDDAQADNTGMCVVTEELSRGSLGVAGSLITRPEILSKALLKGGTQAQKEKWLPLLATGERMAGVAATEPDYGSDVAGFKVTATRKESNGQKGWVINGVKTWCTFAGYADSLMVLCRTNPDMSLKHKGLSLLIAEKPRFEGHEFSYDQPEHGGHIEGKAIPTIGYRGMHSYEVAFENYWVPEENLIGGEEGLGKGFYLQMEGFAGGRLQTAARALGVMQAAFEAALRYSNERKVFNKPIFDYTMTQWKITRMAAIIQACRQATFHACQLMDNHKGSMEASLVKFYTSKVSEWVTREALQIHGGYGYAEEYAVSRYFVDARVFSIFEGAEEVLALRVIAPALLKQYL
ncbi:MAG: acyl-CoA/acyl-ACP dehydrogenase [Deltaproteobacteria bacterium]|nr:MAG: acyl-CoA/acyl-ACP dehydrogenase [Deltaproteobacteria bacterium]